MKLLSNTPNGFLKSFLLVCLTLLILLPASWAVDSLTCEGEGQIFFKPEYVEERTISIPCYLYVEPIVNASCIGYIEKDGELISVYPKIEDVGLFGRSATIQLSSDGPRVSFVVEFPNRDLLNLENFTWTVKCGTNDDSILTKTGDIVVEYPFSESMIDPIMTLSLRDTGQVFGLAFFIFFFAAFLVFLWKVVLHR